MSNWNSWKPELKSNPELFDVIYTNVRGEEKSARYCAWTEPHALSLFNSEKEADERVVRVDKVAIYNTRKETV